MRFSVIKACPSTSLRYDALDDMVKVKSIQKKFRDSWTRQLLTNGTLSPVVDDDRQFCRCTYDRIRVTAGGIAEMLSKETFTIPFRAMVSLQSGATRQANNHHIIEALSVDPITGVPDGKHSMFFDIGGAASATVTNMLYYVQNGGLARSRRQLQQF